MLEYKPILPTNLFYPSLYFYSSCNQKPFSGGTFKDIAILVMSFIASFTLKQYNSRVALAEFSRHTDLTLIWVASSPSKDWWQAFIVRNENYRFMTGSRYIYKTKNKSFETNM